ncbi:hypothetical protein FZC35_01055 [Candidatus Cytomitobacter indipagum]|uniref:Uncharacterized protein n=2 Tax=Candidatus Cytomitobacter indipagum TaxID=2601575 RepID=A0A5C0UE34_9PROT|nr:hypothetical protein FZC35_01055 [Candidatus Cytomitobacter indipagum]
MLSSVNSVFEKPKPFQNTVKESQGDGKDIAVFCNMNLIPDDKVFIAKFIKAWSDKLHNLNGSIVLRNLNSNIDLPDLGCAELVIFDYLPENSGEMGSSNNFYKYVENTLRELQYKSVVFANNIAPFDIESMINSESFKYYRLGFTLSHEFDCMEFCLSMIDLTNKFDDLNDTYFKAMRYNESMLIKSLLKKGVAMINEKNHKYKRVCKKEGVFKCTDTDGEVVRKCMISSDENEKLIYAKELFTINGNKSVINVLAKNDSWIEEMCKQGMLETVIVDDELSLKAKFEKITQQYENMFLCYLENILLKFTYEQKAEETSKKILKMKDENGLIDKREHSKILDEDMHDISEIMIPFKKELALIFDEKYGDKVDIDSFSYHSDEVKGKFFEELKRIVADIIESMKKLANLQKNLILVSVSDIDNKISFIDKVIAEL